jgi:periplasmic protein TonB
MACLTAALAFAAHPEILRIDTVTDSQIVHKVMPPYPGDAADLHVTGVVKMTVMVGIDGHVRNVKLISGHPLLAPAAMQAARQWVFKPFEHDGQPARAMVRIEIPFPAAN